jgi:U3 small nucleolar RNA-associated protein 25
LDANEKSALHEVGDDVEAMGKVNGQGQQEQPEDESAEDEPNEVDAEEQVGENIEDDEDASDPFEIHFSNPEEKELAWKFKAVTDRRWRTERVPFATMGKCTISRPDNSNHTATSQISPSLSSLKPKKRLTAAAEDFLPKLDETEKAVASQSFDYHDMLFGGRTVANSVNLRTVSCLHALNHVLKTRDRVLKNSARLSKDSSNLEVEYRDQGFTRPKVLILVPTRQSCVRYMDAITYLCQPEQQENKKRFEEGFANSEEKHGEDRPEDFRELFEGNDDDMFRLGVKFTRKTVKYFSQFYNSDIILASPLGLRRAIDSSEKTKKPDFDFLSSIEIVIMDQTDAMLMQNWEHVTHIFEHLNLQPREAHGCDFSRVRTWYLDGNAKFMRQTIILSAFITPELNALVSQHCHNIEGKVKFVPEYSGAMLQVRDLGIKQSFSRFDSPTLSNDPNTRFKYFTTAILPTITKYPKPPDGSGLGVLIFIPSYFDFVRVRNFFSTSTATQNISFSSISENQVPGDRDIRRARSHFLSGRHSVLLYTGRAHHFFRYRIRGVKKVIMYGAPENPIFYQEIVGGFLGSSIDEGKIGAAEVTVRNMFSKWDALALERIVGTKRVGSMLREKGGDVFDFI